MSVHFSSKKSDWETPQYLFDPLDREFQFNRDVCATGENAKCIMYHSESANSLIQHWFGVCWMNPPYGRGIGKWVKKAYESTSNAGGSIMVCLLPARTDTKWFHKYVMRAAEVRFIKGRVKFVGAESGAPFPSMVVVFRPGENWMPRFSSWDIKDEAKDRDKGSRRCSL